MEEKHWTIQIKRESEKYFKRFAEENKIKVYRTHPKETFELLDYSVYGNSPDKFCEKWEKHEAENNKKWQGY